jgi:hypothetical protein
MGSTGPLQYVGSPASSGDLLAPCWPVACPGGTLVCYCSWSAVDHLLHGFWVAGAGHGDLGGGVLDHGDVAGSEPDFQGVEVFL